MRLPFNKPYLPWSSFKNMIDGALSGTIAGNGKYTKKCHRFFEQRFGFNKVLMTTSCSDALEMASLLCRIEPGDEVIMPSFTFMSAANAFLMRGARVVFADTHKEVPNIDPDEIEKLIKPKTKVIVVAHYSGLACDMDKIMKLAAVHRLFVVEDAAHAIDACFRGRPLGSIGHFGAFSFHETKNIISGEGGLLMVNSKDHEKRAEIIWEKGTNRAAFYRGEVDKYQWIDVGSSFLPSDSVAALLYSQLLRFDKIQHNRKKIWWSYDELLKPLEECGHLKRPVIPEFSTVNGSSFYITVESGLIRDKLLDYLKKHGIGAVFHYLPLHSSPCFIDKHDGRALPNTDRFSSTILRLPFYYSLKKSQIKYIVDRITGFFT